jgi:hypothetical protein
MHAANGYSESFEPVMSCETIVLLGSSYYSIAKDLEYGKRGQAYLEDSTNLQEACYTGPGRKPTKRDEFPLFHWTFWIEFQDLA